MFLLVSQIHIFQNFAIVGREVRNGFFKLKANGYERIFEHYGEGLPKGELHHEGNRSIRCDQGRRHSGGHISSRYP